MGAAAKDGSRRENDALVSFVLRALQLAFSAMALTLVGGGFKGHALTLRAADGEEYVVTTYLGGPTVNYVLLVTFSASLYTLLWIVFVHLRRAVTLPLDVALGIDALFAVLTIGGGCAFLASDYLGQCDLMEKQVRCGVLKTGAAFVLVTFLLFLCSVAWGAHLRLNEMKNKALRGDLASAIDVIPFEDEDVEHNAEAVDYIANDRSER